MLVIFHCITPAEVMRPQLPENWQARLSSPRLPFSTGPPFVPLNLSAKMQPSWRGSDLFQTQLDRCCRLLAVRLWQTTRGWELELETEGEQETKVKGQLSTAAVLLEAGGRPRKGRPIAASELQTNRQLVGLVGAKKLAVPWLAGCNMHRYFPAAKGHNACLRIHDERVGYDYVQGILVREYVTSSKLQGHSQDMLQDNKSYSITETPANLMMFESTGCEVINVP